MSDPEVQESTAPTSSEEQAPDVERAPAAPIESRFLFVDVSALRAKQLRRGAKPRLPDGPVDAAPRPAKAERLAMAEVRHGLVDWELPDFKLVVDTR